MAIFDQELKLSDQQLINAGNQVWSTNTIKSNSLRDLGRGVPLYANLTIRQKPTNTGSLFRFTIVAIGSETPPVAALAFAYTPLVKTRGMQIETLVVGSRISIPLSPLAPNLADPGFSAILNDWNHNAIGDGSSDKKWLAALYENVSTVDDNLPTSAFANLIVDLDIGLQPTQGNSPFDQQFYPGSYTVRH